MLLQNLHCRYLYILIKLPHLLDLEQKIPSFPNCDNYGSLTATNPDPLLDDIPTNDNELCKVQPHCALLGYPFHDTTAHMEATPTREGI